MTIPKLVMASDMAEKWGVDRRVVNNWSKRDADFPKPIQMVGGGKYPIYLESDMIEYGASKGLEWHFEHDEFLCEECRTSWGDDHKLNLYLGIHNGQDAQKYVCTNPDCDFMEIKTFDELGEK